MENMKNMNLENIRKIGNGKISRKLETWKV